MIDDSQLSFQPAILRGRNWTSNSAAGVRARCSKTGFCMQFTALIGQPKERGSTIVGGSSFEYHGAHAMGAIGLGICNVAVIAYGSTQRSVGRKQASVREVNHLDWTVPNHNFFDKPGLWFISYLLQENISLEARYNHVVERGHSSGRT